MKNSGIVKESKSMIPLIEKIDDPKTWAREQVLEDEAAMGYGARKHAIAILRSMKTYGVDEIDLRLASARLQRIMDLSRHDAIAEVMAKIEELN
ncbi:MAG TPA: hypothetical protein DET40_02055 [Lentisphaeria bacterium]|nr:MAG: hypothetical protein A2X45_10165 [Lentisphaerae bacterium GWF2_50_93]HCE42316.1 hypothetical protein [Lentisphaeria bacterium]